MYHFIFLYGSPSDFVPANCSIWKEWRLRDAIGDHVNMFRNILIVASKNESNQQQKWWLAREVINLLQNVHDTSGRMGERERGASIVCSDRMARSIKHPKKIVQ